MRFLIVILLIVAGVAALGFYRGWFRITSDRAADQPNVTVTVDKDKVQQDKQKARKGAGVLRVRVPPGNWVAPAGSNRSGGGGNEAAGASGVKGRPRATSRAGGP